MLPESPELAVSAPLSDEPVWTYLDLLLVVGWIVAPILVLYLAFRPAGGVPQASVRSLTQAEALAAIVAQVVLYGWVYLALHIVVRVRHDRPVLPSLGWRRSPFNLMAAFGGGIVLALAISGVAALAHTPEVPSPLAGLTNSTLTLILIGLLAATVAPFFEELFFRGFLQPLVSRTFGAASGILITAVIFGSLHGPEYSWQWQYAVAITCVGAVLGWVRYRSGSIIPSTVLHGAFNSVAVVALIFSKYFSPSSS